MMKHKPPSGVIGPNIVKPSNPIRERILSKYREPQNNTIPNINAIKEMRMDAFLALEKVERNNNAKV
ncbi:hypothetical protein GCM10017764_04910 [Sphingobacterium griseoflavum]|uniref:Uncharacterized protein n=1 Tax=Sphingobacterium griseoflavum TaxID=1474952 RepID=A0ABQ3HQI5_9SPHI|nr:hypothetical protein GCM10017764_04910 [Sphingobacterium griseoflavum]